MAKAAKLEFDENSPKEMYDELYKCDEGYVFKVNDYETVMQRIEDYKPAEGEFETFPINPGTEQYSLVGPDHCVIVKNTTRKTLIVNG